MCTVSLKAPQKKLDITKAVKLPWQCTGSLCLLILGHGGSKYLWLATTLSDFETSNVAGGRCQNSVITPIMLSVLWLALGSLLRIFHNRQDLIF